MPESSQDEQHRSSWRHLRRVVYVIDALQILGVWQFIVAVLVPVGIVVMGYVEELPWTAIGVLAFCGFFVALLGPTALQDWWQRKRLAAAVSPVHATAEDVRVLVETQRTMNRDNLSLTIRQVKCQTVMTHIANWDVVQKTNHGEDWARKATAAFLISSFGERERKDFLDQVSRANPEDRAIVAMCYLQGLQIKLYEDSLSLS